MKKLLLLAMAGVMVGCKIRGPGGEVVFAISLWEMFQLVVFGGWAIFAVWVVFSAIGLGWDLLIRWITRWFPYRQWVLLTGTLRRIPNPFRKRGHDDKANQITSEYIAASSTEFRQILQLSCLQLVAADQQFTSQEQEWVDAYFGPGAGDAFIQQFAAIDWDQIHGQIQALYENLPAAEKEALQTNARAWFTELLLVDGLEDEELAHLESLMSLFEMTVPCIKCGGRIGVLEMEDGARIPTTPCPFCGASQRGH